MVNIRNFIASLKCTWIKKLTQRHNPWMDIFKEINGNDFQKRLIDFGDVYFFREGSEKQHTLYFGKLNLFFLCV